jgi:chromate reductase, NAD(P)H dehydrogenase (quinone)
MPPEIAEWHYMKHFSQSEECYIIFICLKWKLIAIPKEKMIKVHILSSTDRPNSNALKVAEYAEGILSGYAETKLYSLCDFPLQEVVGGKYGKTPEAVQSYNSDFLDADGFLFVIPEYNGGFPGILKLFYDYLPFPESFEKAPVSLIGEAAGAFGALRAVEQFEQLLKYRKAYIFPERMFIQRVNKQFDEEEGLSSEKLQEALEKQLCEFPEFVKKLKKSID